MTSALVPSEPLSPAPGPADNSLEMRQFYREFRKYDNQAKQKAAVVKQVVQPQCNQLPKEHPGEPQPGPFGESNGASQCIKENQRDNTASSSDEGEWPKNRKRNCARTK